MAGLLDRVLSESYIGGFDNSVSPAIEAEVNSRIINDEDSSDMMQYTGECMMGMLAIEAVVAQRDGEVAIECMYRKQIGDIAGIESVVATFEGFLGNAWEKIKEWIKKAYTAIKNFLIKIWNKLKGYANQVKAFFTKYGDVLRNMTISGLKVDFGQIKLESVKNVYDTKIKIIDAIVAKLSAAGIGSKDGEDSKGTAADEHIKGIFDNGKIPSPHQIQIDLNMAIYGYAEGYKKDEVDFENNRTDIIEAADINNASKYINHFLGLGDQGMKYDLNVIETSKKQVEKESSNMKENGQTKLLAAQRRCINARLEIYRMCSSALTQAAKRKCSLAVAACRKAIMHHHTKGEGATPTTDSWNPTATSTLEGMLAQIV